MINGNRSWPTCHLKSSHWDDKSDITMFSKNKPSQILITLSQFCVKVYFTHWFNIKCKNQISDDTRDFYSLQRILIFSNKDISTC